MKYKNLCALVVYTCAATMTLIGCGAGENSGSLGDALNKGTVNIVLTDKPADITQFRSINATIDSIVLMGGEDDGQVMLPVDDNNRTIDLLSLKNESMPFAIDSNVPTGKYCKIRLNLTDLQLVLADDTPDDDSDNETIRPKLPGNGKLDLVVRGCFQVEAGSAITLQIDIDAGNSIHLVENGNGYIFRPVVFVDVLGNNYPGKLIRFSGEIAEVDESTSMILLCKVFPASQTSDSSCIDVHLGDKAAFFDNENHSGTPRPLAELLSQDNVTKQLNVVAWGHHQNNRNRGVNVPKGHLPPPGECRLWDTQTPPGLQSAPINCDDVPSDLPDNTVVVTHEGVVVDNHQSLLTVEALALELGEFSHVEGESTSVVDSSAFSLSVGSSMPELSEENLMVMIQEGENGVNGTRIVSRHGYLLGSEDIRANMEMKIDGIIEPVAGSDTLLHAALIIVDTETTETNKVTGVVTAVDGEQFTVDPEQQIECGTADELFVLRTEHTKITTVVITDDSSEIMQSGTIALDQKVGLNGYCKDDEFVAYNILIVDDRR